MTDPLSIAKPRRIGIDEVVRRVNKRKSTIYARMKLGMFPQRNQDGWLESDIDQYVLTGKVGANDALTQAAA